MTRSAPADGAATRPIDPLTANDAPVAVVHGPPILAAPPPPVTVRPNWSDTIVVPPGGGGVVPAAGVTGADGAEKALVPAEFVAVTSKVYGVPFARPLITVASAGGSTTVGAPTCVAPEN